ncbi:MAG: hypothetical protein ACJ8C4_00020 [Gemmataceae bacterium]
MASSSHHPRPIVDETERKFPTWAAVVIIVGAAAALVWFFQRSGGVFEPGLPSSYDSVEPAKGQWVIEVPDIDPAQVEKLEKGIKEVPDVAEGFVLVNPSGGYIAFRAKVKGPFNMKEMETVRDNVVRKLIEMGCKPGKSKTQERSPAPSAPPPAEQ